MPRIACSLAAVLILAVATAGAAAAHTGSDFVAVPAGEAATVKLKPTHGCGESPTVQVSIQAPVEGATAGQVAGWTGTATDDGQGHTVLEWTGGSLPAHETGEFPVTFMAPDAVGELLTFPSVQRCENGEELAWISGDPADDFPAPRLLVLPAGSEPAETLDQVAADAPGRDQLAAIVDVDDPADEATTTTEAITTSSSTATTEADESVSPVSDDDEDSAGIGWILPVVVLLALGAGAGVVTVRRYSSS